MSLDVVSPIPVLDKELFNLIMVEAPYNRLFDLRENEDGGLTCRVKNEYIEGKEGGPIGCAEFGRHLAILGSMVLAKDYNFGEKYYFLAVYADLKRHTDYVSDSVEALELSAVTILKEKRKGRIAGKILNEKGEVLYSAEVEYQVLNPKIFDKFYGKYKIELDEHSGVSPYAERKKLSNVQIDSDKIAAEYGEVMPAYCAGHFRHYPALPVAIVGGLFNELGHHFFASRKAEQFEQVIAISTVINAYRLAFHGEQVRLEGEIRTESADTILLFIEAKVGDSVIADALFELKGIN